MNKSVDVTVGKLISLIRKLTLIRASLGKMAESLLVVYLTGHSRDLFYKKINLFSAIFSPSNMECHLVAFNLQVTRYLNIYVPR